jgi:hypothetical protein
MTKKRNFPGKLGMTARRKRNKKTPEMASF